MKSKLYNAILLILTVRLAGGVAGRLFALDVESEFAVALSAEELTMDPLHAYRTTELQIATGVYEGLVTYHPATLRPMPGAAYRWEITNDGASYRFFLRSRGRFSNGEPVTAADFRDSWFRIIDPVDEGEYSFMFDVIVGAYEFRIGELSDPEAVGIRISGDYVLEVDLTRPASHFLSMLCHMTFATVYAEYRDSVGWETFEPLVTNGPFSLELWNEGQMVLKRNEHYWDVWNVALPRIRIDFSYDAARASEELNSGELDWTFLADAGSLENPDVIQVAPLFATSYLYFRSDLKPWSDFRVRKGLARLVPWNAIREEATSFGTETLVPSLSFYPDVEGLADDNVEAGLEFLASAGYPNGVGLPAISILVIPGSVAAGVAREIKEVWERLLEVEVQIIGVSFRDYQDEVERGGFTIGSSTWIGDFADPLAFLQMWTGTSKLNDARYVDDTYDELVTTAMGESGETRFEMLSEAERRLLTDEVVVIPLSHTISVNFIDLDRIGGWSANALDVHPFKNLYYKEPAAPRFYAMLNYRVLRASPEISEIRYINLRLEP